MRSRAVRRHIVIGGTIALVMALALLLVARPPQIQSALGTLQGVSWRWLTAALAVNCLSIVLRSEAWRILLGTPLSGPRPTRLACLSAYCVGLLGNTLLPARAGELARTVVMKRRLPPGAEGWAAVAGSVLAQRCLDVLCFAALVLVVVATGSVPGWLLAGTLAVAGVGVLFVIVLTALSRGAGSARMSGRLRWVRTLVREGLASFNDRRVALRAGALQAAGWAAQLMVVDFTLRAFSAGVPLIASVLVLVLLNGVLAFPLWPGGVGAYQAVVALALGSYGVASATGLTLGLGIQAVETLVGVAVGLLFAAHEGLSLAVLRRRGRVADEPGAPV
jgi:uncharacterized protein (TIRG00374 family)